MSSSKLIVGLKKEVIKVINQLFKTLHLTTKDMDKKHGKPKSKTRRTKSKTKARLKRTKSNRAVNK